MPESAMPGAIPVVEEVLATLERCLVDLDLLGIGIASAHLSRVIEALRFEVAKAPSGAAAATQRNP